MASEKFSIKSGEKVMPSEGTHGIDMKLTPSDDALQPGSSYFWDAPQLPSSSSAR